MSQDFHLKWKKVSKDPIGKGAFGEVFKIWLENGEAAAVKEFNLKDYPDGKASKDSKKLENEIEILRAIEHENIIKYYEICLWFI